MQVDVDLIEWLRWKLPADTPVEQGKLAEDWTKTPAITLTRRSSSQDVLLSGAPSIAETEYDVDIYGEDIDAVQSLADLFVTPGMINGFRGQMQSTFVLGAFVEDQADDYVAKIRQQTDEGLNISSFVLRILH